jgi:gamma-glutamylputrescine oxidase
VQPHMIKAFPQLRGAKIDYAWGGQVSVTRTRLPHIGRRGSVFFAYGYSGQGVVLSTFAAQVLVEALAGTLERFDVLTKLKPPPFPGGKLLRHPLHVAGMLYYALKDRLP